MFKRIRRILLIALCAPLGACATFESTLVMTATTRDGDQVVINAKDGALSNNIASLIADAQFTRGADGSSDTVVNLGSERETNTDNQASVANNVISTAGTVIGAVVGAGATQSPVGAAGGAVAGNAVGKMIGDVVSPPPKHRAPAHEGEHPNHDNHGNHKPDHHKPNHDYPHPKVDLNDPSMD